jgi:Flp pilus assembly protein TadG
MTISSLLRRLKAREGATLIFVALAMIVLLGMAALAIDVGYLYVVRGELQNAADSGALAGAQVLYNSTGSAINTGANDTATAYVASNYSEQANVQVQSVERGHWSFATRTFTPNTSTVPVDLWNVTTAQLDANTDFINAVRVITTRKTLASTGQPEQPFFARIFGAGPAPVAASAVAYIGFAGTLPPATLDQPIAICKQSILVDGKYTCSVGRMINSGSGNNSTNGHQTGGWTNFTQPCNTFGGNESGLVCQSGGANSGAINLGQGMGTSGGMVQTVYDALDKCWRGLSALDTNGDKIPDQPWKMTLSVIDCPGNNVGPCSQVVGAVTVDVVWITETDKNQMKEVPRQMGGWSCPASYTGQQCWDSFVSAFNLQDVANSTSATYEDKTIYFLPDCTPHETMGTTGGQNFGMLAKIPVLVK